MHYLLVTHSDHKMSSMQTSLSLSLTASLLLQPLLPSNGRFTRWIAGSTGSPQILLLHLSQKKPLGINGTGLFESRMCFLSPNHQC